MNLFSRTISGVAAFTLGVAVIGAAIFDRPGTLTLLWVLGWGGVVVGIGVYLLLNTKEDEIEEINDKDKDKEK